MSFRIEILERLRNLVFRDRAIVLGEMRHQFAGFRLHSEEEINEVNVEPERAHRLFLGRSWRGIAYRRGIGRRHELSPTRGAKNQGEQQNSEITRGTHAARFDERNGLKESIP